MIHDRNIKWVQRDGTKIALKDMTDSHVINTLKGLESGTILNPIDAWGDIVPHRDGERNYWMRLLKKEVEYRTHFRGKSPEQIVSYILKENGWVQ